ncbi:hypothetical protein AARAC_009330 [Aspergillus arachidicola]|uniref:Elongation factor 3 four helical bundle domain-containing protein n=1 Tax=Aspergillus arachidicola TaxID=656916 RepID=A0A2G7FSP0_9EURO|nr:hypothetical protein AARAC_009330 [Aspergillus arachidicola]
MGAVVFAGRLWGVFSFYPNPTRGLPTVHLPLQEPQELRDLHCCWYPKRDSSPQAKKQVQNPNAVITYVGAITELVDEKVVETVTWTQNDLPCLTSIYRA